MTALVKVLAIAAWMCGMVLAAGWWKLLAFIFPVYAWYLLAERVLQSAGLAG